MEGSSKKEKTLRILGLCGLAVMVVLFVAAIIVMVPFIRGIDEYAEVIPNMAVYTVTMFFIIAMYTCFIGTANVQSYSVLFCIILFVEQIYAFSLLVYFKLLWQLYCMEEITQAVMGSEVALQVICEVLLFYLEWQFIVKFTDFQHPRYKLINTVYIAVVAAVIALFVINIWTGVCFYVDDYDIYYNAIYDVMYLNQAFFILVSTYVIIKANCSRFQRIALFLLVPFPIVQAFHELYFANAADFYAEIAVPLQFFLLLFVFMAIQEKNSTTIMKQAHDMEMARNIQLGLLPPPLFTDKDGCVTINASMDTAKEVGGDLYDYYMIDESHVGFTIGDVSGKGVPAALFMTKAMASLKTATTTDVGTAEVFKRANNNLRERNGNMTFVTVWGGIFDLRTGMLTYTNAGHNPPIIFSDGEYRYLQEKANLVMGVKMGFRYTEHELIMKPGDRVFLYTDGITEEHNKKDELYGEERLITLMNNHKEASGDEIIELIKQELVKWRGNRDAFDDDTMLMFTFNKKMTTAEPEIECEVAK